MPEDWDDFAYGEEAAYCSSEGDVIGYNGAYSGWADDRTADDLDFMYYGEPDVA